jgi:plastocyanin
VKFVTSDTHSIIPSPNTPSDPGLQVGFNAVVCLQFTAPGTFDFLCNPHRFVGTVTVN